jgi:hypothetical protein
MSEDFLAREQAVLGGAFSSSAVNGSGSAELDLNRAASAYPDLNDFDQNTTVLRPANYSSALGNGLGDGFGDFESIPSFAAPPTNGTNVKITGGRDEVDRFESEYPDLGTVRFATSHQYSSESVF